MTANPHIKPLKLFDPKKDLLVNEKFAAGNTATENDPFGDLSPGEEKQAAENAGQECCNYKTGGAISTDLVPAKDEAGRNVLIATNAAGQIIMLSLEGAALKPLWGIKMGGSIVNNPALADGILYCVSKEGLVIALNTMLKPAGGRGGPKKPAVLWQQRFNESIMAEPVATGKILVVTTIRGIYAFDAYYQDDANKSIGKLLWRLPVNGIAASPSMDSGYIYAGSEDKTLYALGYGGTKATVKWKFAANEAFRMKPFISLRGNYILAAARDGTLYCLNKFSGQLIWTYVVRAAVHGEISSAEAGGEERFYFGAEDGSFHCVDMYGKPLWNFKTGGKIRGAAMVSGDTVYFGSGDNHFYALDAHTGTLRFKFATDGNISGRPVLIDNTLFFGSTDSFVYGVYAR